MSKGSGYYPDGANTCPPNYLDRRYGTDDNPTVVFEVLSPSTVSFDRRGKADDYKTLSSLQNHVLIETETIRVEVFSRLNDGGWVQRVYLPGTSARFPSVDIEPSPTSCTRIRCSRTSLLPQSTPSKCLMETTSPLQKSPPT